MPFGIINREAMMRELAEDEDLVAYRAQKARVVREAEAIVLTGADAPRERWTKADEEHEGASRAERVVAASHPSRLEPVYDRDDLVRSVSLLASDDELLESLSPMLDGETRAQPELRWTFDVLSDYFSAHQQAPGYAVLRSLARKDERLKGAEREIIAAYIDELEANKPESSEERFYAEIAASMLRRFQVAHVLKRAKALHNAGREDDAIEVLCSFSSSAALAEGFPDALSCHDIAALPEDPTPWLVEGLIKSGGHNLVAGASGSAKSWALLDLEVAVASGQDWFHRRTEQRPVLHIDEDVSIEQFKSRVPKLARGRGLDWEQLPIRARIMQGVHLADAAWRGRIIRDIRKDNVGLVVFETARELLSGDENNSEDVQALHDAIQEIRMQTEVTTVLSHHTAKDAKRSVSRGSGVFIDKSDVVLRLSKRAGGIYALGVAKNRWGAEDSYFTFELGEQSGDALTLEVREHSDGTLAVHATKLDGCKDEVIALLQENDGAVFRKRIDEELGAAQYPQRTITRALDALVNEQRIRGDKQGGRKLYALTEEASLDGDDSVD